MDAWFDRRPRKPLIIRGARQVGKSTLVTAFARSRGIPLHVVNLERHPELDKIFRTLDIPRILRELDAILGRNPAGGLLFLDEIQAAPGALQALRYFHEQMPDLPMVAAGSLLDFALSEASFSMPVGRIQYRHLRPLTFEEFLAAMSLEPLRDRLRGFSASAPQDLPLEAHAQLVEAQRMYLFTGGMPEAVSVYARTRQAADATLVQRSILDTYRDDFAKYATRRELARLQGLFDKLPLQVGKKVKYAGISREEPAREIKAGIRLLAKARILSLIHHSDCAGVPLAAQADPDAYKLLFLDVGLMNRLLGLDWLAISKLDERRLVNEGPLAEQFVGTELLAALGEGGEEDVRLFYWLREGRTANAEVDYVVSRGDWIVPVEVKAGKAGGLKSVHQFVAERGSKVAVRLDLGLPSFHPVSTVVNRAGRPQEVAYRLLSLPLYLTGQLPRLLDELRLEASRR
ncbi:MAG: ATP-binding protein [Elusimicrobia bacterium]|nr:ATP-binding protein [Elusimicrobiota bacterium]